MGQTLSVSVSPPLGPYSLVEWRSTRPVDQCLGAALICLAPVLLWDGRWDGYPLSPSGRPGTDEMHPWPRAERDEGITVPCTVTAAQLFLADM